MGKSAVELLSGHITPLSQRRSGVIWRVNAVVMLRCAVLPSLLQSREVHRVNSPSMWRFKVHLIH
ncbi:hypothetical protein CVS30_00485 [Arthrobacter psychrolactophilus]|uniref:Uncharacterized protein n=1 Tax=Arthrobacter psychrolactophilus TaxID=92442 RepID=A0A2V5IU56_9MICC|nr:hypothetical protein CVS30_00485 [Arthrobacter psychrolactophilus]